SGDLSGPQVVHLPGGDLGPQPQRRLAPQLPHPLPALLPLGGGEVPAGALVGARRGVRGARRLEDLPPRAVALVDPALVAELLQRRRVGGAALGLAHHRAVPVDPERREILQLALLGPLPHPVEILHPQVEGAPGAPGEHPGEHCGAQVPQVQVAAGGGGVAARSTARGGIPLVVAHHCALAPGSCGPSVCACRNATVSTIACAACGVSSASAYSWPTLSGVVSGSKNKVVVSAPAASRCALIDSEWDSSG